MRTCRFAAAVVALIACGSLCAAAPPEVKMAQAKEYPHAGVALAVPQKYTHQMPVDGSEVMRAVLTKGEEQIQSVSLSAYPLKQKVTLKMYANALIAELRADLAIRGLKVGKKVEMKVGDVTGAARRLSYTYRGEKRLAVQLCFLRKEEKDKPRICYVLSIETTPDHEEKLLPAFAAIVKSVKLTCLSHPHSLEVKTLATPQKDYRYSFSIRPPAGWYAAPMPDGIWMGITDYLYGGAPLLSALVVVQDGERTTAEQSAKKALQVAIKSAGDSGAKIKVLSQGAQKLAGYKGYQFVLKRSKSDPTDGDQAMLYVQRVICVPGPGKATRRYSLTLAFPADDAKRAKALMETIAGGFALLKPTTQPTTTTAPAASRPAASGPAASKPATAAAEKN